MSDVTLLLLRLSFLALLWLFVLLVVAVLRAELSPKRGTPGPAKARGPAKGKSKGKAQAAAGRGSRTVVTLHTAAGSRAVEVDADQITFGRKSDNTVTLTDDYSSGHHCRLIRDGKVWRLEDVGSTNGTFVKGNRISGPVRLKAGSRFSVGGTEIEIS